MKFSSRLGQIASNVSSSGWLPEVLAGLAGIIYFVQSVWFAYGQPSVLDEGNYAYKGWLFVTGQYIPYQDYGPWTTHTPLSFLIFGYIQLLFGPGLRSIRYFVVFVGCLFLLGVWFAARRLGGRWLAMAGIWVLALNPFEISSYSVGITQVLAGCMLVWMLFFILGEGRSGKELFVGAILAAILVLTRENFILILPFVFAYLFWQHGKKAGLLFAGTTLLLFFAVNQYYWPGIMTIWAKWLPKTLVPYVSAWVYQGGGVKAWLPKPSLANNVRVFFSSIRLNFIAVFGAAAVWLAWPKGGLKDRAQFRSIVLLTVLFIVLYVAHVWASFGKDYCPDCLINYVSFFFPLGLLLLIAFAATLGDYLPKLPAWPLAGLVLILAAGMGYSNYETTGQFLTSLAIPRISNFTLQPGTVELWRLLANKFGLDFQFLLRALPAVCAVLVGVLVVGLAYGLAKRIKKSSPLSNPVYALIFVTFAVGIVLSPTILLSGMNAPAACSSDVIAAYEKVGAELAQRIPPGSHVYWRGDPSPAALLYVPGIKIYPPQLNAIYSFVVNSDTDKALRFGYWNAELDQKWLSEADVLLIQGGQFMSVKSEISPSIFNELEPSSPIFPCDPDTRLLIFKRK